MSATNLLTCGDQPQLVETEATQSVETFAWDFPYLKSINKNSNFEEASVKLCKLSIKKCGINNKSNCIPTTK